MGLLKTINKREKQRPVYQPLNVDLLEMADYQRGLKQNKVANYVKNYDPMIFGTILVSYRDNRYWIVDGPGYRRIDI